MARDGEIDVEASPEEVCEALATEEGRERWLDEPDRQIHVESAEPPHRLVWWWASEEQPGHARRLPIVVAAPAGDARDGHRERAELPAALLAAAFEPVRA